MEDLQEVCPPKPPRLWQLRHVHHVLRNQVYGNIPNMHRPKIGGQVGHIGIFWWTGGQRLGKLMLWRDVHLVRQNPR